MEEAEGRICWLSEQRECKIQPMEKAEGRICWLSELREGKLQPTHREIIQ